MLKFNLLIIGMFLLLFTGCLHYDLPELGAVTIVAAIFMYSAGDAMYEKKGK